MRRRVCPTLYACSPDLHTYLVAFFQEEREGGEDTYLGRKLIYPDLSDVGRFASMLLMFCEGSQPAKCPHLTTKAHVAPQKC